MKLWNGWFRCEDRQSDSDDNLKWCLDQFGPSNTNARWFFSQGYFYFNNEADAMWFVLRW